MTDRTKFAEAANRAAEGDPVKRLTDLGVDVDEAMGQAGAMGLDAMLANPDKDPREFMLDICSAFMTGISIGVELAHVEREAVAAGGNS